MSSFQDFVNNLGPKLSKDLVTADQITTEVYPTASLQLNQALGGGIGGDRLTLIFGNYSSGKSMLVLQTIAGLQKQGKVCGFIDVEKTFDPKHAESLGVDTSELIVAQVTLASQVEEVATSWIKAGMDFIAVDSISALFEDVFIDKKTQEMKGFEDRGQIGAKSVAIKRLIKGIMFAMTDTNCAVVLISQTTTEIGQTYVKQVAEGGKAPGFFSTQIVKLISSENDQKQIKQSVPVGNVLVEQNVGRRVNATVVKNKLNGKQSTTCSYDIYYRGDQIGIDNVAELVDMATEQQIIKKAGAWFTYDEMRGFKWQGRKSMLDEIKSNEPLYQEIKEELDLVFG